MTSNHFFIKRSGIRSRQACLDGKEHHHLSQVARIKRGDQVWLFDEEGMAYLASVDEIAKNHTKMTIIKHRKASKPTIEITVALAVSKPKTMEWIIQKATEMGVSRIVPVLSARSLVKAEGYKANKLSRWERIAREAVKQCKSGFIPSVSPLIPLDEFLQDNTNGKKIFLSEKSGVYLKEIFFRRNGTLLTKPPSKATILVGPEGGWTPDEESFIIKKGFEPVSLGKNILRTETAALGALSIVMHFWNTSHVSSGKKSR